MSIAQTPDLPLALKGSPARVPKYHTGTGSVVMVMIGAMWFVFPDAQRPLVGPVDAPVLIPAVSKTDQPAQPASTAIDLMLVPAIPLSEIRTIPVPAPVAEPPLPARNDAAASTVLVDTQPNTTVAPQAPPTPAKPDPVPAAYTSVAANEGVVLPGFELVGAYDPTTVNRWLDAGLAVLQIETDGYGTLLASMSQNGRWQVARPPSDRNDLNDPRGGLSIQGTVERDVYPVHAAMAQAGFGSAGITSIRVELTKIAVIRLTAAANLTFDALGADPSPPALETLQMRACFAGDNVSILQVSLKAGQPLKTFEETCE